VKVNGQHFTDVGYILYSDEVYHILIIGRKESARGLEQDLFVIISEIKRGLI